MVDVFSRIVGFIKKEFEGSVLVIEMEGGCEYSKRSVDKLVEKNGISGWYRRRGDWGGDGVGEGVKGRLLDEWGSEVECSGLGKDLWLCGMEFCSIVRN
ncbi:hypothetical protein ACRFB9_28035 [Klebsiella pneumoniae]